MTDNVNLDYYVCISGSETEKRIKVPVENDELVLLSMVRNHFPLAVGLNFRNPTNSDFSEVILEGEIIYPPNGGWSNKIFLVSFLTLQSGPWCGCSV